MTPVSETISVWLPGGVTAVPGFTASGVHAGIKQRKPDTALIAAPRRCTAAATFTRNVFQAAPLHVTRRHLADGHAQAVVVVSGIANTCTGEQGERDAQAMAEEAAAALGIAPSDVIVASTGVIGTYLPMERVRRGIRAAAAELSSDGGPAAAQAIMTTDTRPKLAACQVELGDGDATVTIGGICKGAGMIHPNMATMLGFLTTDAAVAPEHLQAALAQAVDDSFNMITVDGDTSPNDMVAILASGSAGNRPLEPGTPAWSRFCQALTGICVSLAQQIVRDGEGARKMFGVEVFGAEDRDQARLVARAVASSYLVKTAVYASDANWGRVIVAAGKTGAAMVAARTSLWLRAGEEEIPLFLDGTPQPVDEALASRLLSEDGVRFRLDLGTGGPGTATAWGCDLTEDYVRINSEYRT
ncbi:MAG TPA: bifunctional glutamate N-acetyltransferase/amino-acid acetyltransferase ArgJ [Bacillota bacterium]